VNTHLLCMENPLIIFPECPPPLNETFAKVGTPGTDPARTVDFATCRDGARRSACTINGLLQEVSKYD
jgi:hypothetical protein